MRIVECLLMLKEGVMHLPELPLCASSFRSLRCMFSMRVFLGQWKVTKDKAQPIPQSSLNLLDDWMGLSTIRTLILTVFHHCHRRRFWSQPVIARTHWHRQPCRSWSLSH